MSHGPRTPFIDRETNWLLSGFGVHARAEVHRGQASRTIVRAVEAYQPDLVIIGASGEHALQIAPAAVGGTTLKLMSQISQHHCCSCGIPNPRRTTIR
jgi:hypothetical protein